MHTKISSKINEGLKGALNYYIIIIIVIDYDLSLPLKISSTKQLVSVLFLYIIPLIIYFSIKSIYIS